MAEIFGTDGARDKFGVYPITEEGAYDIGRAAGDLFTDDDGGIAVVARDPRKSGEVLTRAVTQGLNEMGIDVIDAGVIPTPGLALATRDHGYDMGVMITASHNPASDNGIKIFARGGNKLGDGVEKEIVSRMEGGVADRQRQGSTRGDVRHGLQYEDFLVASAEGVTFDGLKIVLDTGHGAASGIAENVFRALGAEVVSIGNDPRGDNINADGYGAAAEGLPRLREAVKETGADMGAAFDGDADRIIMLGNKMGPKESYDGDRIMYTLAKHGGADLVVATVMSNLGAEQAMAREGITMDRRKVGDRYVLEGIAETGAQLGGEQSGHIIIPHLLMTGDGMLAAIRMAKAVVESGRSLDEWAADVPLLPQKLVNIPVADKKLLKHPDVVAFKAAKADEMAGQGRLLIRPSGTEPKARVMVESPDAADRAEAYAAELQALLTKVSKAA